MAVKQQAGSARAGGLLGDPVRDTYDRSAALYDLATRADDYDRWVGLYLRLLRDHGVEDGLLVDLGCGTGKGALRLAAAGYQVTGVDLSPEILRAARAKPGADRVSFIAGDLRHLPDLGLFDVAVTLGEPLNYLADLDELLAAFKGVARLLMPGGLFVFDLNTRGFYQSVAGVQVIDEHEGTLVLHRGRPSPRQPEAAELQVDYLTADSDGWRRTSTVHSWSYFPPDETEHALTTAGLTQVASYGLGRDGLHPDGDELADRKRLIVARQTTEPGRH